MPFSAAASRYQSPRQLRQKPADDHQVDILHIGALAQMRTRRRKTAASSSVVVMRRPSNSPYPPAPHRGSASAAPRKLAPSASSAIRSCRISISTCGRPRPGAMDVQRIAFQRAGIGLIVAHGKARLRQPRHQRPRQPAIAVPQHADLPGPRHAFPGRRETVNRNQDRRRAQSASICSRDGGMIGRMKSRDAAAPLPPHPARGCRE